MNQSQLAQIPLRQINPDPLNARKHFDAAALQELADSIRENGLIQPVTVRIVGDGSYQLIAGERRFRACKLLGWESIEAKVAEMDDQQAALAGLIENLQREDLDPFEEGGGYRRADEDVLV